MSGADTETGTGSVGDTARTLPIYNHADELLAAVKNHQVVIVEGPTGSGKTTQLPRLLYAHGVTDKMIGVTQPRRIAAVSVAARIAQEEEVVLGEDVGYAIRFDDKTSRATKVKVMTDGILLQEARGDEHFSRYGVLIIDEAHERSLNIDFILGLLHEAVTWRHDLRVIVSSATIRPAEFQAFFGDVCPVVPLVSIDARPYPVDVDYAPVDSDYGDDIAEAAAEEILHIHQSGEDGHVLCFMPGEGMIHKTMDAVLAGRPGPNIKLLPLFGRLERKEQERVFDEFEGKRKVIVSTNIAETSITVDNVRFVVDSGLAKIPRMAVGSNIVALEEEGISKASADQRAGRAGRTAPGRAIRMYSRKSYNHRPDFTDEEILRLELSAVMLRLIDLGISDVEKFPFPTKPGTRKLRAALEKLERLAAIDGRRKLTDIGKRMVPFPLTPPLARMVVEAADRYPDVLDEVLIVGAWMSAKSPWLYPAGEEDEARRAQQAMANSFGDALTAVDTFRKYMRSQDRKAFAKRFYLDRNTMAFIAKAHGQLSDIAKHVLVDNKEIGRGGVPDDIIKCLAAGFADNILRADGRVYTNGSGARVTIHPSSSLFRSPHRYILATEIVVSHRTYGRNCSAIKSAWLPEIAPNLARQWRVRSSRGKRKKDHYVEPESVPSEISLGGVDLPVTLRGGQARVELLLEDVATLRDVGLSGVPAHAATFKARIAGAKRQAFAEGLPLGLLMGLLPYMPLPQPDQAVGREIVEGALLEIERNAHAIERGLDDVLRPSLPQRGKKPGWVMMVANGGGAYWFEVNRRFGDALGQTVHALDDLLEALPDDDGMRERVETLQAELTEKLDQVDDVATTYRDRYEKKKGGRR